MRNIAKCKLCKDIIESFHATDHVFCKCGEISVHEGAALKCTANDFNNFLRVDDNGNEIIVTVKDADKNKLPNLTKPSREDMLKALDEYISNIENLPSQAKLSAVNNYDLLSLMIWLSSFFKLRD